MEGSYLIAFTNKTGVNGRNKEKSYEGGIEGSQTYRNGKADRKRKILIWYSAVYIPL